METGPLETPPAGTAADPPEARPAPAAGAPWLSARGLVKSFRLGGAEISVLQGVDLDVAEGEFVAIQGSSGAGKSTLLHLLGLLDRPTSGTLHLGQRELARASESERTRLRATEFAFVFQFYYLLAEFDAAENVAMPAMIARGRGRAPRTAPARRERAHDLLARVGLGHRLHHRPHQLSGGERQRVAIARALMNAPRIVFCDEPTGNLDSRTAAGIHELLREINERERQTIVAVTHEEAMARAATRRLRMVDGRIESSEAGGLPAAEAGPAL